MHTHLESNILIPFPGLILPEKWAFVPFLGPYVNGTRWEDWNLGTKTDLKHNEHALNILRRSLDSPRRQWGPTYFSLFLCCFSEDYDTVLSSIWSSHISASSWRGLLSSHKYGGMALTGRDSVCLPLSQGVDLAGMKNAQEVGNHLDHLVESSLNYLLRIWAWLWNCSSTITEDILCAWSYSRLCVNTE